MYHSTVLIIGLTWPEPSATAAGLRMMQLIRSFLDNNFLVMVASAARKTALSADLSHLKIDEVPIRLNHSSFDIFIKKLQPGIVLFDRYLSEEQFGWRVAEYAPGALRILDTEDLHSLRASRQRALEEGRKFYLKNWLLSDITKREIGSIYRSDLSLIISDYELDLLQNIINIDPSLLLHLPFMQDPVNKRRQQNWLSFEERHHFIFIGNGKHAPNTDAILWLNKEIWPLIRKKLPEAQLHIYGSYLPGNITKLHRPEAGFFIYGWVRETEEVLERARVNLAPLRFGAGIKGKLVQGMRCGTPAVSTVVGAEGIGDVKDFGGAIAESAGEFATAAVKLFQNRSDWRAAQLKGAVAMNQQFNRDKLETKLRARISELRQNLEAHRSKNFIGAMLLHHTLASTKYMAKWIEGKNNGSAV